MMKRIPPHIAWPLMIVGFLLLGVTWSLGVVVASQSDGGPAVVNDYYQKAINWDQEIKRRARSDAFKWSLSMELKNSSTDPTLVTTILDAMGEPVDGFQGSIIATRPQIAEPVAVLHLVELETAPGVYVSAFPQLSKGIWDFKIDAENDAAVVYTTMRKEF